MASSVALGDHLRAGRGCAGMASAGTGQSWRAPRVMHEISREADTRDLEEKSTYTSPPPSPVRCPSPTMGGCI